MMESDEHATVMLDSPIVSGDNLFSFSFWVDVEGQQTKNKFRNLKLGGDRIII